MLPHASLSTALMVLIELQRACAKISTYVITSELAAVIRHSHVATHAVAVLLLGKASTAIAATHIHTSKGISCGRRRALHGAEARGRLGQRGSQVRSGPKYEAKVCTVVSLLTLVDP